MSVKIETSRLGNGLRLGAAYVKGTSFVTLMVAVRVGPRYEAAVQNGMSHFLEHMMFRGCKAYPSSFFLNHALESLGDGLEAGTSREYTMYSVEVPHESLTKTLEILGDLFRAPTLEDVETEKEIIFEEMLEELDEKGEESDLENIARRAMFGDHPLGQPVLGRRAQLEGVSAEDLREYFREFYQPDNMVMFAAGDVDPKRFFKSVNDFFGELAERKPDEPAFLSDAEPEDAGLRYPSVSPVDLSKAGLPSGTLGPKVLYDSKAQSQLEVLVSFLAEGERSPAFLAQMAVERILDDGLSSRLQRSLCERKGLLYDIEAALDGFTDVGVLELRFRIVEKKARLALREIFRELHRLKTSLADPEELAKVKARMSREAVHLFESPRALAARLAEAMLLGVAMPRSVEEWRKRIDALTAADVQQAAQRMLQPERMVAVIQGEIPELDKGDIGQVFEYGLTKGF